MPKSPMNLGSSPPLHSSNMDKRSDKRGSRESEFCRLLRHRGPTQFAEIERKLSAPKQATRNNPELGIMTQIVHADLRQTRPAPCTPPGVIVGSTNAIALVREDVPRVSISFRQASFLGIADRPPDERAVGDAFRLAYLVVRLLTLA